MHVRSAEPDAVTPGHRPVRRGRLRDGHPDVRQRVRHRERRPGVPRRRSRSWPTTRTSKGVELGGYSLLASRTISAGGRRHQPEDGQAGRRDLRQLALPGQPLGRRTTSASSRHFIDDDGLRRARARRLVSRRRLRLDDASGPSRPGRFAVDAVADDHRLLPVVPRRGAST